MPSSQTDNFRNVRDLRSHLGQLYFSDGYTTDPARETDL